MRNLTKAQKQAVKDLEAHGGAAWVCDDAAGARREMAAYARSIKALFGDAAHARWKAAKRKYGITDKMVKISNTTLAHLLLDGVVVPIEEVPGAFRLSTFKPKA